MGLIENNLRKAVAGQLAAFEKEAGEAGIQVLEAREVSLEEGGVGSAIKHGLLELMGQGPKPTLLQVVRLGLPGGLAASYVQPYQNQLALPGELHVELPGRAPAAALLAKGLLWGSKWRTGEGAAAFGEALAASAPLKAATKALRWSWNFGSKQIDAEWAVQLRPRATSTRVCVKSARYGGFMTTKVGVKEAAAVVAALAPVVASGSAGGEDGWLEAVAYEQVAGEG